MMKNKILLGLVPAAMMLLGSSMAWADDAKIDCSTASDDVAELQAEKKSTSNKKAKGIFAITPIGMIANATSSGDKKTDAEKMDIEEYNKKLDAHIARIQAACPDSN